MKVSDDLNTLAHTDVLSAASVTSNPCFIHFKKVDYNARLGREEELVGFILTRHGGRWVPRNGVDDSLLSVLLHGNLFYIFIRHGTDS